LQDVPPLGPDSPFDAHNPRNSAELRLLEAGALKLELANIEQQQKINVRRAAILAGGIVVIVMIALLIWFVQKSFWWKIQLVNPSVGVAMIVAPIVSITAIVVAVLVGAFRRFDEKDLENVAAVSSGAAGLASNGIR
jgi:hypothetical protein